MTAGRWLIGIKIFSLTFQISVLALAPYVFWLIPKVKDSFKISHIEDIEKIKENVTKGPGYVYFG